MNADRDTSYRYSVQFHFDPNSDWQGEKFSYELPPKTTEDRTLLLNPFEMIGFLEVRVFPNHMDAAVIESTDVHMTYQPPDGAPVQEKIINVIPGSAQQFWRLRLDNPNARDYSYRFVHHLKDGTVREELPATTRATALPVDDPFVRPLKVDRSAGSCAGAMPVSGCRGTGAGVRTGRGASPRRTAWCTDCRSRPGSVPRSSTSRRRVRA